VAGAAGFAGVSNYLVLEILIMRKAKKPGINQRIGKRKDDVAALDQRSIQAAHDEIERLKAENEELKKRDFIISSNRNSFM
jgi:hypothetical protein